MKQTIAILILAAAAACGGKSEPATTPANTADTGGETYGGETYGADATDGAYGGGAYGGYGYGGATYTPKHYDTPALARAECEAYVKKVEAFIACPKVPKETGDAARQGIDAMKQAWASWDQMPVEQQDASADACHQAVDALTQGATSMGCTI